MTNNQQDPIFTRAVHAGEDPAAHLGALSTPVFQTALFAFPDAEQGALIHEGQAPGFHYSRIANPTQAALEKAIAELEGGEAALAVASGMAAISMTLLTLLRPGDHLVAGHSLYGTTNIFLHRMLEPLGFRVIHVDQTDPTAFEAAITPDTGLLYIETPANPTLTLTDIEAVTTIARERGLLTVADNTFATPVNQLPLALGVDVVVHSATKYLGGHGDLVAGAIVASAELIERLRRQTLKMLGGSIAPWTAWLLLRGIKTLPLRVERHNSNALRVAEFLAQHPKVRAVHYPGLPGHPQHSLALRQMKGFGGMVAFEVDGVETARRLVNSVKLCALAVSLGDVASLIQHPASMTHAAMPVEQRRQAGITDGLLRLSVGIERAEDIIADLDQALR